VDTILAMYAGGTAAGEDLDVGIYYSFHAHCNALTLVISIAGKSIYLSNITIMETLLPADRIPMELIDLVPESLLESSIGFSYLDGGITPVPPGDTSGWRVLPFGVVNRVLNGRILVETAQGFSQCFEDGQCLVMPPDIPHCLTTQRKTIATCHWAHVRYTALDTIDLLAALFTPRILPDAQGEVIGEYLVKLAELSDTRVKLQLLTIAHRQALGFQLFADLLDYASAETIAVTLAHNLHRLVPVLHFIRDHFIEDITRCEMAKLINLSPTRFYVLFKQSLGLSPSEYLKHVRMKHAQRLLLATDDSIADIAGASGFPDVFHFSRTFKSTYGRSPSQYRRAMQGNLPTVRWT